ncbi:hypothetical protein HZC31_05220 [Candidatus Woesearchaeota archaeon]|nr:hypothetical protein [Candidatus Woesearchaeota archaeon]
MTNSPFSIDALLLHMDAYCSSRNVRASDPRVRYELKEIGVHYVIDQMELEPQEKTDLKTIMSRRICLEQALATETIPNSYLRQVIEGFPEDLRGLDIVQDYLRASQLLPDLSGGRAPCPVKYDERLSMIVVRQEGIRSIVQAGIDVTGPPLRVLLHNQERVSLFNVGGEAVREYLDASLVLPRGNA